MVRKDSSVVLFFFCILTVILQAILTGGTVIRITIDPNLGGCTLVEGGHPPTILTAGYIGSTIIGGVFVLAGWDTLVAKICSMLPPPSFLDLARSS